MASSRAGKLATEGHLRASLNVGNPVLARSMTETLRPAGIAVDLARALARELQVDVVFLEFDTAAKSVQALGAEEADIAFMAIDPVRAEALHFTPAYLLIEGAYLVRQDSALRSNHDVDRPGHRIVVASGSAYALHLERQLSAADLVKVPSSDEVVPTMLAGGYEAAAGVRQQLASDSRRFGGTQVLEQSFMTIRQAMATPKSRGAAAAALLDEFIVRMTHSGFVAASLARHGIEGVKVATD